VDRTFASSDPYFWLTPVISVGFALAAAFAIYSQNTSWGVDAAVDAFAVFSAILAAAGLRSIFATGAGK
jgi:hypothetical protein